MWTKSDKYSVAFLFLLNFYLICFNKEAVKTKGVRFIILSLNESLSFNFFFIIIFNAKINEKVLNVSNSFLFFYSLNINKAFFHAGMSMEMPQRAQRKIKEEKLLNLV